MPVPQRFLLPIAAFSALLAVKWRVGNLARNVYFSKTRCVSLPFMLAGLVLAMPGIARAQPPGDFDFYVLALSWSPSFCAEKGEARGSAQCGIRPERGFVVHGLWPQFNRGYPSQCGPARAPDRAAMALAAEVFPDDGLARYQWRKHGTCSGEAPGAYFRLVKAAREQVVIPPVLQGVQTDLTLDALAIERAFGVANAGLRPDMMSVQCAKGPALREVYVCFSRDLRSFTPCPEVDRKACRARDIRIPAAR